MSVSAPAPTSCSEIRQLGNGNGHARLVICDPIAAKSFENQRLESGLDRYDEVWNGVAVAMSLPTNLHQHIVGALYAIVRYIYGLTGPHQILPGANVSDRQEDWMFNHRCPDVVVFFDNNPAINYGTHWCGGPDFLTEVISPGDPAREKLPFYESINTREVLIVDRDPWQLEIYQLRVGKLELSGISSLENPELLVSSVLPLSFRLVPGQDRPQIEINHRESNQTWLI